MQLESAPVGTQLLLGSALAYVKRAAGWEPQLVLSADDVLARVRPEQRAAARKNLERLHPSRSLLLSPTMLLRAAFATSGSSVIIRKVPGGFTDPAVLDDVLMTRVADALGLTLLATAAVEVAAVSEEAPAADVELDEGEDADVESEPDSAQRRKRSKRRR